MPGGDATTRLTPAVYFPSPASVTMAALAMVDVGSHGCYVFFSSRAQRYA